MDKINIIKVVKKALKDKELIIKDLGSKVKVTYKSKRVPPRALTFPRAIPLNEELGELFGLYYGEGATSKDSWTCHIQFTNSDPGLVNHFLMLIEDIFGFQRNNFSFRIKAGDEAKRHMSGEGIIKFWKRSLKIKKDKEIKLYWDKEPKNSRHRIMATLGSIIFRRTIDEIMDIVLNSCLSNHEVRKGFIRGLFAAEGTVSVVNGSLRKIIISQGFKDPTKDKLFGKPKREFIKELFRLENMQTQNNKKGVNVTVTNLRNLEIFNNLKLYNLHNEKKIKFESGFENLKNSKRAGLSNMEAKLEILDLLLNKGPKSILEISKLRETGVTTTKNIVSGREDRNQKGLLKNEFVFISKKVKLKHSIKPIRLFDITNKGKIYLESLKKEIYGNHVF